MKGQKLGISQGGYVVYVVGLYQCKEKLRYSLHLKLPYPNWGSYFSIPLKRLVSFQETNSSRAVQSNFRYLTVTHEIFYP